MLITITAKPQVTIHPGREDPGTGYHAYVDINTYNLFARDLSDSKIKHWERNRYDFEYVADYVTGTGLSAANTDSPTRIVATGAGTVAAGAKTVSVYNVGGATGALMGSVMATGSENVIDATEDNVLDTEISYDATGTTFEIIVIR